MDSKLRWKVFFLFALFFVGVVAVVFAANAEKLASKWNLDGQSESEMERKALPEEEQDESGLSDFMLDETFFDPEESSAAYYTEDLDERYDLMVTSVEKDLRVKVVNRLGEPAIGKLFYIVVEEVGEYKDLDQDGMIYIGGLQAGEYYVSLKGEEGSVSSSRVRVAVRDKVEYTVIDDISYLMKTEDEIDPLIEDTEVVGAIEESDGTEITTPFLSQNTAFGIDVSKWNKEIDWNRVKESGVEFAIIRCGYRGSKSGYLVEDPYFEQNIKEATQAGIKVGLYFFTQAVSEVEAVEEASMAIALCDKYKLDYPIFIDTEGAGGEGRADLLEREMRTNVCKAFCETISSAGYSAGVYASKNWFLQNLNVEPLQGNAVWLAEYKSEATYSGDYHMWQYTSNGSVDGIEGRVDLNVSYLK